MADQTFHHGHLRMALIDLAIAELRQRRFNDLSLRDLAKRLGVSTAAPYRHFARKDDLLRAVSAEGHARVLKAYETAETAPVDASERLRIACRAYLDMAFGNPGLFDLLFFTQMYAGRRDAPAHEEGSAFAVFERLVAARHRLSDSVEIRQTTLAIWSLLHGFVTLRWHGRIDHILPEADMRQAIIDAACAITAAQSDDDARRASE